MLTVYVKYSSFSGQMQLRCLNSDIVVRLIPQAIPDSWYNESVMLDVQADSEVLEWLQTLWDYLRRHRPQDLADLTGLPLLTLKHSESSYEVVPLSYPSVIVLDGAMGTYLNEDTKTALCVLGVRVISEIAHFVQSHAAVLGNFIRLAIPEDITEAISTSVRTKGQVLQNFRLNTTDQQKDALRDLLCHINSNQLTGTHVKVVSSLPIFTLITQDADTPASYVCINDVNQAAPVKLPPIKINAELLDIRKDSAHILAKKLNVKVLSVATLLTDFVFKDLSSNVQPEELERTLNFVIDNLHSLQQENPDFISHLQHLPFLKTEAGTYVNVSQVFDPESQFLQDFFYGEPRFPTGRFAESQFVMFLRQFGLLQSVDITANYVHESVLMIAKMKILEDTDMEKLKRKSSAILQHLKDSPNLLNAPVSSYKLRDLIKDVRWLVILQEKPSIYPEDLQLIQAPLFLSSGEVLPLDVVPIVGMVAPVCADENARSFLQALGLPVVPAVHLILRQLGKIAEAYQPQEKAKYLQLIMSIYAQLEMEHMPRIKEALHDVELDNWIWHGDGFTNADKLVSRHTPIDLRPYLYSLPGEMHMFEAMFKDYGIRDKCSGKVLVSILQDIHQVHSTTEQDVSAKARDLQLAIDILNLIKSDQDLDDNDRQLILIPTKVTNFL